MRWNTTSSFRSAFCAIKCHAESTHADIPTSSVSDLKCPCANRILSPVVNRHEWPTIITLCVDEVIVSIWQED